MDRGVAQPQDAWPTVDVFIPTYNEPLDVLERTIVGALAIVYLLLPIAIIAIFSFNDGDVAFPLAGFTLDWYRRFFSNPKILQSLERSASSSMPTPLSCTASIT